MRRIERFSTGSRKYRQNFDLQSERFDDSDRFRIRRPPYAPNSDRRPARKIGLPSPQAVLPANQRRFGLLPRTSRPALGRQTVQRVVARRIGRRSFARRLQVGRLRLQPHFAAAAAIVDAGVFAAFAYTGFQRRRCPWNDTQEIAHSPDGQYAVVRRNFDLQGTRVAEGHAGHD